MLGGEHGQLTASQLTAMQTDREKELRALYCSENASCGE